MRTALKMLSKTISPLKVKRINTYSPVWAYRLTYTDKFPGRSEFKHTVTYTNVENISEFMECMVRLNKSMMTELIEEYSAACSCSSDCIYGCYCWQDNMIVYNLYGDIARPVPKPSQLMLHFVEDDVGVTYRVGHSPNLDAIRENKPRFQFEIERFDVSAAS